ncbi:MAG TPA: molybdopterin converting factor subunit 1 [Alphaproteobacteria bacterium]|nr:molybdopterin converting factor subunit 1 [Alphaproteobacteria bacterium]
MKILYFAWVKAKIGKGEEDLTPPEDVRSVQALVHWLQARGEGYAEAFADQTRIRAAVNQDHADFAAAIGPNDEIAFFPPVTGG